MGNGISSCFTDYHVEVGPVVRTKCGDFCGKTFFFHQSQKIHAFLGVPFAKVGTYENRFKKANSLNKCFNVKDCQEFGPRAIQGDLIWERIITNVPQSEEDCLNMCIFAPSQQSTEFPNGRPVMVFLHGGGYLIHSAAHYGDWNICKNLCFYDVVVCTIQYRLGLLGFLSSGDDKCPGNFGLWDQVAAFRWIRENISAFGGDSTNITAFGQSAGASSLDFLSISPKNDGFGWFDRIILMGGNGCAEWAMATPEMTQRGAINLLRRHRLNENFKNASDLVAFIQKQPVSKIAPNLIGKSAFNRNKNGLEFCPVVDGDIIPLSPNRLRQSARKICTIVGTADCEALLFHALGRSQSDLQTIKKFLKIHISDKCENFVELRDEALQLYLCGVNLNKKEEVSRAFLKLYSDILMNNSTQKYVEQMVMAGHDVYRYNMTYFNPDSFGFFAYRMPFLAATHCHDLRYLFGKGLYAKFRPNYDDMRMLDIMTTLWTNYAKYGNPNGHPEYRNAASPIQAIWKKVEADDLYSYMELSLTPEMKSGYQGRRYEFWKKVETSCSTIS